MTGRMHPKVSPAQLSIGFVTAMLLGALVGITGCARYQPFGRSHVQQDTHRYHLAATSSKDPQRLSAMHLGNANVLITDGTHHLLVDGFFSRPGSWLKLLFGTVRADPAAIEKGLAMAGIEQLPLDAVLVGHSHFDHALDAPLVTMRHPHTRLYGSASTRAIALAHPSFDASRFIDMTTEPVATFGQFTVTFIPSAHAKLGPDWLSGLIAGTIESPPPIPSHASAYKDGGVYAIHIAHPQGNVLVQTSAGFIDGHLAGYPADVVFLTFAGMDAPQGSESAAARIRAVLEQIAGATGAKTIVPIHWDDFTRPIDVPLTAFPSALTDIGHIADVISEELEDGDKWGDAQLLWLPPFVYLQIGSPDR